MSFNWNLRDGKDLKIGIGFEKYLLDNGFLVHYSDDSNYFNTYNHCARVYKRGDIEITIGLIDSPCRVGICHPFVVLCDNNGDTIYDYTYAPSEGQYEHFLNVFSNKEEPKLKRL